MKKTYGFRKAAALLFTVILGIVTALSIRGTVYGMDRNKRDEDRERMIRQTEKAYIREVREVLRKEGYTDAGVTLQRVVYGDGIREYELLVNHRMLVSPGNIEGIRSIREKLLAMDPDIPDHKLSVRFTG